MKQFMSWSKVGKPNTYAKRIGAMPASVQMASKQKWIQGQIRVCGAWRKLSQKPQPFIRTYIVLRRRLQPLT